MGWIIHNSLWYFVIWCYEETHLSFYIVVFMILIGHRSISKLLLSCVFVYLIQWESELGWLEGLSDWNINVLWIMIGSWILRREVIICFLLFW